MYRLDLEKYILGTYPAITDHPWSKYPDYTVFRHSASKKWFALIMSVPKARLNLQGDGDLDIVNLKCEPTMISLLQKEKGFFPAYHMSKENWISVALDGSVTADKIKTLLELSFQLTAPKITNSSGKFKKA